MRRPCSKNGGDKATDPQSTTACPQRQPLPLDFCDLVSEVSHRDGPRLLLLVERFAATSNFLAANNARFGEELNPRVLMPPAASQPNKWSNDCVRVKFSPNAR